MSVWTLPHVKCLQYVLLCTTLMTPEPCGYPAMCANRCLFTSFFCYCGKQHHIDLGNGLNFNIQHHQPAIVKLRQSIPVEETIENSSERVQVWGEICSTMIELIKTFLVTGSWRPARKKKIGHCIEVTQLESFFVIFCFCLWNSWPTNSVQMLCRWLYPITDLICSPAVEEINTPITQILNGNWKLEDYYHRHRQHVIYVRFMSADKSDGSRKYCSLCGYSSC